MAQPVEAISTSSCKASPFRFPPLPEQRRIVGILDEAFNGIATAKANAEKNLQNARALFESHLQSVFTERGEGWIENHGLSEINYDSDEVRHLKDPRKGVDHAATGIFVNSQTSRNLSIDYDNAGLTTTDAATGATVLRRNGADDASAGPL